MQSRLGVVPSSRARMSSSAHRYVCVITGPQACLRAAMRTSAGSTTSSKPSVCFAAYRLSTVEAAAWGASSFTMTGAFLQPVPSCTGSPRLVTATSVGSKPARSFCRHALPRSRGTFIGTSLDQHDRVVDQPDGLFTQKAVPATLAVVDFGREIRRRREALGLTL